MDFHTHFDVMHRVNVIQTRPTFARDYQSFFFTGVVSEIVAKDDPFSSINKYQAIGIRIFFVTGLYFSIYPYIFRVIINIK